jgi:RHH-type transcriptional regulator, rel operon repressor / antitoxin RelB
MDKRVEIEETRAPSGVVRIPKDLDARLTAVAERTNRSKSFYARKAISSYLDDLEDYLSAVAALESSKERISLGELRRRLKLEN